jgi:small multidrug resistance pump
MIKVTLVLAGIFFSALAQIILKKSSYFDARTFMWCWYIFLSLLSYFFAFITYSFVFKFLPISKASPLMTIGVMVLVVIAGVLIWNETISRTQFAGIFLGAISIYLLTR